MAGSTNQFAFGHVRFSCFPVGSRLIVRDFARFVIGRVRFLPFPVGSQLIMQISAFFRPVRSWS